MATPKQRRAAPVRDELRAQMYADTPAAVLRIRQMRRWRESSMYRNLKAIRWESATRQGVATSPASAGSLPSASGSAP